ncbi:helix-turn-helix domain-containing protein [Leuconostoc suionicum]|uniref:winged helix-turn-helix transcriptional regulator n=1 Tax=Leuconostoc suionicum TaxID=1511761 RepID=UPI0024AC9632|nr:helix-turn-helix domain-containing protein [Leuconostoc suionicum]MDI6498392.1 helix-turn-helix domain-containing protein [Leuconostoc suionicum]MDI6500434.1 helix-turn-helix domain-containing protein [Leuconostoc suionicum]MDI6502558.1 helix-turn-helix domain-containing protein [Leuconostoc suionicum]MDI6614498.1 helix-turn-helix domain-containing protein [Leuconostoc suionicum]MDI6650415.1 helix-turn-helix domain-containing protein [Leuconostoc suionicum]
MEKIYHIGVEATLDVIGGKWKPIILCHLGNGPIRTGELRHRIPNIAQKTLTQQLRELEADEIIVRKVYNQVPPKVEYYLSEEGKTLREVLIPMSIWGEKRVRKLQSNMQPVNLLNNNHEGYLKFDD